MTSNLGFTLCAAAAAAVVIVVGAVSLAENPKGAKIDQPKPVKTFAVTSQINMKQARDPIVALRGRVVLLTFVDTYSERIVNAIPDMTAMNDRLGARGLTILNVFMEEERPKVEEWLKTNGVKWGAVITDTEVKEKIIQREFPMPGFPWTYVIDANGMLVLHDHPQGLKDDTLAPYLDATFAPPLLPETFADAQAGLDAGLWTKARASLQAAIDGGKLSKIDAGWAKNTIKWIDMRRPKVLAEADALLAKGWTWDAWWTWDDFTRKFEGLEGCDVAKQKADAARAIKDSAAVQDLTNGDDIAKAKDYISKGKLPPARLILERIAKLKTTRFAERAKDVLVTLPPK
ncbi:MAG: hypothetical protein K8T90_22085 [Planctomycetes bacterium]|nr:hypothetical protein [Planctomycetota bacterium]